MPPKSDPVSTSVWARPVRSRGGGQPALSLDQIVRATVELLDAEGLGGLSMRRLGTRLSSGATSIYWYVATKDDLLELAVDAIMGEIEVPDPAEDGWRPAAAKVGHGMRAMMLRHPWITPLLGVRPTLGPNAMRLSEQTIKILLAAGFTGMDLAHASNLVMAHAFGSAVSQVAWRQSNAQSGVSANEVVKSFDKYQNDIADDYPNYSEWWRGTRALDEDMDALQDQTFEFGLNRLLDGLEAWLDKKKNTG